MNCKSIISLVLLFATLNNFFMIAALGDYFKISKRPTGLFFDLKQSCNKENMKKYAGNVVFSRLHKTFCSTPSRKVATTVALSVGGMWYLAWRALPQSISLSTQDVDTICFGFEINHQKEVIANNDANKEINTENLKKKLKRSKAPSKTILCHGNAMSPNSIINFLKNADPEYLENNDIVEPNHTGNGFFGPFMNFISSYEENGFFAAIGKSFSLQSAFWWLFSLRTLGFGRERDACGIIKSIKEAVDKGKNSINGVGISWGGATWTTALHMLAFPEKYDLSWWKALGLAKENEIDTEAIIKLKEAVQKGTVVLTAPWLDDAYPLAWPVRKIIAPLLTDYNPSVKSRGDLLIELINGNHYNIQVNLAQNDEVVGNKYNKALLDIYNQKINKSLDGYSDEQIKNHECFYCNEDLEGHNNWDRHWSMSTSDYIKPIEWKTVCHETKFAKKTRFCKKFYVSRNKIFDKDDYKDIFEYIAQDKNPENCTTLKQILNKLMEQKLVTDDILKLLSSFCQKDDSIVSKLSNIDVEDPALIEKIKKLGSFN